MKRWFLQVDREGRGRSARDQGRRQPRLALESLERRLLLKAAPRPTFPPYNISVEVSPISDPAGSGQVFQKEVTIDGIAPPISTVWLAQGKRPGYFTLATTSDATGHYSFQVPVGDGLSLIQVFSETLGQNYSNVATLTVSRGNAIVAWDAIALRAFENQGTSPAEASRDLAILHSAQYDAVAAVDFPNAAYQVHATPPKGTSAEAAADSSAVTILNNLFPALNSTFANAYKQALAGLPTNASVANGLALGKQVADQTLADRANDGSNAVVSFPGSTIPGRWRPTPPALAPAVDPQFGKVTPFIIASGSEFRPAAPPAVGSSIYDQALAQVASLGRVNSTTRTADQSAAAAFWTNPVNVLDSPGPWNSIAEQFSVARKDTLDQDARIFAQLDFALADTAIASADSQYSYDEWRPISAVQQQVDPSFIPLATTPASPSYVSDQAAYGAAASDILASAFGSKAGFTYKLPTLNGMSRTFTSFAAASADDANSQVYAGISFAFDAQAGLTLGDQVGQAVLSGFPKAK